jgi:hypothetical protein
MGHFSGKEPLVYHQDTKTPRKSDVLRVLVPWWLILVSITGTRENGEFPRCGKDDKGLTLTFRPF